MRKDTGITEYPKGFTPLVVTSFKHLRKDGFTYKRRLRISSYNIMMLESILHVCFGDFTKPVVLKPAISKKVCKVLGVEDRPMGTYLHVDFDMCSYRTVPGDGR